MNVTIGVSGMSCNHCVRSIQESVSRLAGVHKVEVRLQEGEASVDFDPEKIPVDRIVATIADQGYDVGPVSHG